MRYRTIVPEARRAEGHSSPTTLQTCETSQQQRELPVQPRPSGSESAPRGTSSAANRLRQSGYRAEVCQTSRSRGASQSTSNIRARAIYLRVWFPLLILLSGIAYGSTYVLDYELISYRIQRQLEGRPADMCIDLPEKLWMRIDHCWDGLREQRTPGLGGITSTDV